MKPANPRARRWRAVSDTEIGTGPQRGPAGAVSLDEGLFHAEAWGPRLGTGRYLGSFRDQDAAKIVVERWLNSRRPTQGRGKGKR